MRVRLIGIYRLTFRNPLDMMEKVRGDPVYLLMAMTADEALRLKPQNLVTGLPIRRREAVN
jgi:predicted ThiF/HesA family dinucleotide-utilizing enzyme